MPQRMSMKAFLEPGYAGFDRLRPLRNTRQPNEKQKNFVFYITAFIFFV